VQWKEKTNSSMKEKSGERKSKCGAEVKVRGLGEKDHFLVKTFMKHRAAWFKLQA